MQFANSLIDIYIPPFLLVVTGFSLSLLITYIGIPSVVKLAEIKSLYDIPGRRTSHSEPTPRLGGAMVFAGVIISSVLFTGLGSAHELKYIIAGMIVLFFIGVKDDIVSLHPVKKAVGQFLAALIIVIAGDIRIECCYGLSGNEVLPYVASVILTLSVVMGLVNSINFIDGIDGLASGVGIMVSVYLGTWFMAADEYSYAVICFSLTGSLIAFFRFNVFGKTNKIFLGDTGSMIIGFLLSVFVIRFLGFSSSGDSPEGHAVAPAIALALLFIPVFDALRVIIIRILRGKSIFVADNNHIHHRVLKVTGSHLAATILMIGANILLVFVTYMFRYAGNRVLIFSLLIAGILFSVWLGAKTNRKT